MGQLHLLEVKGDFACFTRPELKVERFSYPIITPSAIRAIYDAIFWKPKFRWQPCRVQILTEPKYISLRRNEVKDKMPSERTIHQWMNSSEHPEPLWADGTKDMLGSDQKGRTQRQTMALKNVHYIVTAKIVPWPEYSAEVTGMDEQFKRRAVKGQCFQQPYFGCREFPAFFKLIDEKDVPAARQIDFEPGLMLYDVFDQRIRGKCDTPAQISLFHAQIKNGLMEIPEYDSPDVLKVSGEVTT